LIYSTYLGGAGTEWGYALAADGLGNVIAVGQSASSDFPTRDAVQGTNASSATVTNPADGYIVKLSPAIEKPPLAIARSGGNVLLSWSTNFTGFVLQSADFTGWTSGWSNLATKPLLFGEHFVALQPTTPRARIFRLRRP
jgi:hypothetical protein